MIKMRRTAHIRWVYGGPARCQPQARHFRDVISLYAQSRGRCWAGTAPSTARTPRSAVRCDAQIGPEGEVAGFALGSSRPRSCQRAGSVKRGGREARAQLGQGGPLRLRECRVGAQKPVSVLWGIQAKPSARP